MWVVNRRGPGFKGPREGIGNQAVSHNRIIQGEPFRFFGFGQLPWDDIQQEYLHSYIGKVAGDSASHDPGAYYGYLVYRSVHLYGQLGIRLIFLFVNFLLRDQVVYFPDYRKETLEF